jgi:hypothetical protein
MEYSSTYLHPRGNKRAGFTAEEKNQFTLQEVRCATVSVSAFYRKEK